MDSLGEVEEFDCLPGSWGYSLTKYEEASSERGSFYRMLNLKG